jgi:Kef-type K+ transport system membrane component KefB
MAGVGGAFFIAASSGELFGEMTPAQILAIASVVGVIAAARSPASAIAIISETRAKGPFSETVLGVSVAMDVVVIVLFSVAVAFCGLAFAPEEGLDLGFVLILGGQIAASIILGFFLGAGMVAYLKRRGPQVPLVILGFCFVVYRCSEVLDRYLMQVHDMQVHLEPLLICAAAGFVIQNMSRQGGRLERAMDRVALPVYVLFFTLAGARLDLGALLATWSIALLVAGIRVLMINVGTRLATTLAGDSPRFRRYCWMGFVTQAGLSLALIGQIEGAYGSWGAQLATVLVAVVAVNQLIGPAAFKFALDKMGEVRGRGLARRSEG